MSPRESDLLVVIDLGSSSVRASVIERGGSWLHSRSTPRGYEPEPGVPGGYLFDPEATWRTVAELVRATVDGLADRVAAVTVTSIREGFVLLDEHDAEVWGCVNIDGRARTQAQQLVDEGTAERLMAIGGDGVSVTGPAKLRWLQEHDPARWDRAARMVMLADWLLLRFGGSIGTDASLGSSSGLFDLAQRTWSPELLALLDAEGLGVPVQATAADAGEVSSTAAAATGLRAGTRLLRGGADTQLAFAAATAQAVGPVFGLCVGTFWQTAALPTAPVIDPSGRLRTVCHTDPQRWMIEGIGFLHGPSLAMLRHDADHLTDGADQLEQDARKLPPGAGGVRWIGSAVQDVGELRHPPVTVTGEDPAAPLRDRLAARYRAAIEDAALLAAQHLELLLDHVDLDGLLCHLVGGAARSATLVHTVADVLGRPVHVAQQAEASTAGLALLAARRCWPGDDPAPFHGAVEVVRPDPARQHRYAELAASHAELRRRVLALADDGLVAHRFRGARRRNLDRSE